MEFAAITPDEQRTLHYSYKNKNVCILPTSYQKEKMSIQIKDPTLPEKQSKETKTISK